MEHTGSIHAAAVISASHSHQFRHHKNPAFHAMLLIASLSMACTSVAFAQFGATWAGDQGTDSGSTMTMPPTDDASGTQTNPSSTSAGFGGKNDDGTSFDGNGTQQAGFVWKGNSGPQVDIIGGNKTIPDSDLVLGETVTLAATAVDSSGTIMASEWTLNGIVVANGTSAEIALNDGTNLISFKATDNDGSSTSMSVTYVVVPPSFQLARFGGLNTLGLASSSEFSVSVRDPNGFLIFTAAVTQNLDITGFIFPQPADLVATADIFVVASTPSGWLMRDVTGNFVPWNGNFANLVPAYQDRLLSSQVRVNIFDGRLSLPGTYQLYVAYMRTGRTELIYAADARVLNVTAQ